jgi:hypothetical protein
MFASCLKSSASSALLGFVVSLMSPPFIARALVEVDGIDGNYSSDVLAARPSRSVARRPRVAELATIQTGRRKKKESFARFPDISLIRGSRFDDTPSTSGFPRVFARPRARRRPRARG